MAEYAQSISSQCIGTTLPAKNAVKGLLWGTKGWVGCGWSWPLQEKILPIRQLFEVALADETLSSNVTKEMT